MSNTIEIKAPDIGDFSEVEVIEVLVAQGDHISAEQSLKTVDSDKASMEIPSPQAGVVKSLTVKVGDKIKEGSVVLQLETAGGADEQPAEPAKKAEPAQAAQQAPAASAPAAAAPPSAQQGQGATTTVIGPDIGDST